MRTFFNWKKLKAKIFKLIKSKEFMNYTEYNDKRNISKDVIKDI